MPPKRAGTNTAQAAQASKDQTENEESDCGNNNASDSEEIGGRENKKKGWSPARKSRKTRYTCKGGQKVCGLPIASKEDCIMCDGCKEWFHPKCQGLSVEAFIALSEYDFTWLCMACKPKVTALLDMGISCLENRIAEAEKKILDTLKEQTQDDSRAHLTEKIGHLEKAVGQLCETQAKVEVFMREQKKAVQTVPQYTEELKHGAAEIKKFMQAQNKDERENNIILHNIPESMSPDPDVRKQHDTNNFKGVTTALVGDVKVEIAQVFRLGKKQETQGAPGSNAKQKPRLIMIKLKDRDVVNQLIKRRTQLKEVGYPNVYLTKDLSPEEREVQKKLREELLQKGKVTHTIFRGKVVPKSDLVSVHKHQ